MNAADGSAAGTHLDRSYAWNDGWHADGDEEFVRASVDLLKDVFAADVGSRCLRKSKKTED